MNAYNNVASLFKGLCFVLFLLSADLSKAAAWVDAFRNVSFSFEPSILVAASLLKSKHRLLSWRRARGGSQARARAVAVALYHLAVWGMGLMLAFHPGGNISLQILICEGRKHGSSTSSIQCDFCSF